MSSTWSFDAEVRQAAAAQFAARGVAVLGPPGLPADLHAALTVEAQAQVAANGWSLTGTRERGEIAQANRRAHLGPVARAYLGSAEVAALLLAATGRSLIPSWSATCYTSYRGSGQNMGEHCDKADTCTIALLTYLEARWSGPAPGSGLQLFVFRGDNASTGLASIVTTYGNRCIVLNGARQAHQRPALAPGDSLLMLAGCFRAA